MNDGAPDAASTQAVWRPAGFWIRLLADIVDTLIVLFPATIATSIMSAVGSSRLSVFLISNLITGLLGATYYTALTGGSGQTTWGKKIFDLKVVNDDGSALGYSKALLRWCAYAVSYLTLCFGFMMAGWNPEKKALHDYIVGTRVVRKGAAGEAAAPTPWKIIGAVVAAGLVLMIALATGGVLWLQQNRGKMMEQGTATKAEGRAFGEKTSQDACVAEAVSRLAGSGIMSQALDQMFLEGCLRAAGKSAGLCDNVPEKNSIIATAMWQIQRCDKLGHSNDQACGRLMNGVQSYCLKPDEVIQSTAPAAAPLETAPNPQ